MSWETLVANARERSWTEVRELINLRPPYELNLGERGDSFEETIRTIVDGEPTSPNEIYSAPGKITSYITDSLFLATKAAHVANNSRELAYGGKCSWAVVDAHHAALLVAKAICGLFGVIVVPIGNANVLVDVFPELGNITNRQDFKKNHSKIIDPIRVLKDRSALVEQKDIWAIFNRILRVCKFEDDRDQIFARLLERKLGKHKPLRNKLLYGLNDWPFFGDITHNSISIEMIGPDKNLSRNEELGDFAICAEMFDVLSEMIMDVSQQLLFKPEELHPVFLGDRSHLFDVSIAM